jgi:hypothetical protein
MRSIGNPIGNRFTRAGLILSHDFVDTSAAHAQPLCHSTNPVTGMKPQQGLCPANHAGIRSRMCNAL